MSSVAASPVSDLSATPKAPRPVLQLVDVRKVFDGFAAVDGISLDIEEGEFVTIVGPSGSGKTTLLRMLAGLESPSDGYITLRGELINDVPSNRRPTCPRLPVLGAFSAHDGGR